MMTPFDHAVRDYAQEYGVSSSLIYRRVEAQKGYKGYRDRHTDEELVELLNTFKQKMTRNSVWQAMLNYQKLQKSRQES